MLYLGEMSFKSFKPGRFSSAFSVLMYYATWDGAQLKGNALVVEAGKCHSHQPEGVAAGWLHPPRVVLRIALGVAGERSEVLGKLLRATEQPGVYV